MKIIVYYTWYRSHHNQDKIVSSVILTNVGRSKKAVTQAIRDYVMDWTGKGHVLVSSVSTTFGNDQNFCDIAQKKFNFNNDKNK